MPQPTSFSDEEKRALVQFCKDAKLIIELLGKNELLPAAIVQIDTELAKTEPSPLVVLKNLYTIINHSEIQSYDTFKALNTDFHGTDKRHN